MNTFSAKKAALIALGVFAVSMAIETQFWIGFSFVDQGQWIQAAQSFSEGQVMQGWILETGYPATTILVPAALLIRSGIDAKLALSIVLALMLSLVTAGIALAAYWARPRTYWWLALAALFTTHHFYSSPDPPSLLIGPLSALFVVLLVHLYETPRSPRALVLTGCVAGCMLATRFDISLLFALAAAALLCSIGRAREVLLVALAAAVTLVVLDPVLWVAPVAHLTSFLAKVYTATAHTVWAPFVPGDLRTLAPWLALAALALVPAMSVRSHSSSLIPVRFIVWLAATTAVLGGVLLAFPFHPIAYFFPLITPWEALFALYGLIFIEEMRLPTWLEGLRRTALPLLFTLFIVVSQFPNSFLFDRIVALAGGW